MILVQIAGKINNIIREQGLRDIGDLEQNLVFGKAGTTELINFFRTNHVMQFFNFSLSFCSVPLV
jgi:syntaxin-binding protein 1